MKMPLPFREMLAPLLLLLLSSCCTVDARKCGTAVTHECKATYDKRYDPSVPVDLKQQNKVWDLLKGYYTGEMSFYDPITFERILETGFIDTISGRNLFQISPSKLFANFTLADTRFYRHMFTFQFGRFGGNVPFGQPGRVLFCDSWSVATWEKDGVANNLKSVCSDQLAESTDTTLLSGSMGYPASTWGISFVQRFQMGDDTATPIIEDTITFSCSNSECTRMGVSQERFEEGTRTLYAMGDLVRQTQDEFIQGIDQAYSDYVITGGEKVVLPMQTPCLNAGSCPTEKDFCSSGDPRCTTNPYQEPDGKVRPGVIAAFVVTGVCLVGAGMLAAYLFYLRAQTERYKEFFAFRMLETMETTDKPLMEFTPEDTAREFKVLEQNANGEINFDNLYEFLSTGSQGYMDYGDYQALWATVDRKKNGTVDFLEFCSVMAHTHEELSRAKQDGVMKDEDDS